MSDSITRTLDGILLSDYLDLLLGNNDSAPCPQYIAIKIALLDPDELVVHVDYAEGLPKVWWKKDWQTHIIRYERLKKKSDLERSARHRLEEVVAKIVRTLSAKMGGIEDKLSLIPVAKNFVKTGDEKLCKEFLGVSLKEYQEAEAALQEWLISLQKK